MAFDVTGRLLIIYSAFDKYLRKNGNTMKKFISYLLTSRKLIFQLGGGLMQDSDQLGIPRKLVGLLKMSRTETYSRVRVGKNVSDSFPIGNVVKQGDAL